ASDEPEQNVRNRAALMLRDIAAEAFEDVGETESLEAVDAIADARALAHVAKVGTREIVALRALSRIEDLHLLGSIARHAVLEAVRHDAVESLRARGAHEELVAVAMNSEFK